MVSVANKISMIKGLLQFASKILERTRYYSQKDFGWLLCPFMAGKPTFPGGNVSVSGMPYAGWRYKREGGSLALLFHSPSVWKEASEGVWVGAVRHRSHPVEHVGEILEEVDFVQAAGAGQGVEDGSAFCSGMAAEEQGVLPGEGHIPVNAFYEIVVPGIVTAGGNGLYAVPFVEEVARRACHLRLRRILVLLCLHS